MSEVAKQHLADHELHAFLQGELTSESRERTEAHLLDCNHCLARLDAMAVEDPVVNRLRLAARTVNPAEDSGRTQNLHQGRPTLGVGTSIGRFLVLGVLGEGGMGVVYEAKDPELDRHVAVKVLPSKCRPDDPAWMRFQREAKALGKLNHEHVVTIYEVGESHGAPYLAMELMGKRSVADWATGENVRSWREIAQFMIQACDGLHAAHEAGVIHRDVKPDNLLLSLDGKVKVGDFGLAKVFDQTSLTGHRQFAGTPHFMSPEQCQGETLDARADVYALGATMFTLLTKSRPYETFDGPMQVMFAQCNEAVQDPRRIVPEIPGAIADIAMRAMAKNRDDRFASCQDMRNALSAMLGEARSPAPQPTGLWGTVAIVVCAAAVIGLIVTFGGMHLWNSARDEHPNHEEKKYATPSSDRLVVTSKDKNEIARQVAEWIIRVGGSARVTLDEQEAFDVFVIDELPKRPFILIGVNNHSSSKITDEDLKPLRRVYKLHELLLPKASISDAGVKHLTGMPALRALDLSHTDVTDKSLPNIARLDIFYLNLANTVVTDEAIPHIIKSRRLGSIDLRHTQVTPSGLKRLREALRDCKIQP